MEDKKVTYELVKNEDGELKCGGKEMRIVLTGSKTKVTYNVLSVDGNFVANIWGIITKVSPEECTGKIMVTIGLADTFIHEVDEVKLVEEEIEISNS